MKNIRVVIFGANGKVGQLLTEYALAKGYSVVAFVHKHNSLPAQKRLQMVSGDIYNSDDVRKALHGADVVVSALSSWKSTKKDILTTAMSKIIPIMNEQRIQQIISLTGAEARAASDDFGLIHTMSHAMIGIIGGPVLRDGEKHIRLLEQSGLDWTVMRSPIMTGGKSQKYRLSTQRPKPWQFVSRRAVARAMIDQIRDENGRGAVYVLGT